MYGGKKKKNNKKNRTNTMMTIMIKDTQQITALFSLSI